VSGPLPKASRSEGLLAYDPLVQRVAYFGPAGTFTEEALLSQADLAAGKRTPHGSVPEVIAAVERGDVDGGVVPIENMIEGSVSVTLDTLAFDSELLIQREIDLPVSLNLCAPPGVGLADIRTVTSFPHAVAQCRGWLGNKLPDAETRASHSTSDAAREVARSKRRDLAAICNALAADLYGLEVLATDIEDHPENETRFVLVGRGVPAPTGHDKTSIVCFQRQDRPGSLLGILQEFAARDVNLTKLESRPTKQGLGDYCFFIDCEGHVADEVVADALRNLSAKHGAVKFLGSYPVGGPQEAGVEKRKAVGKAWKKASAWVDGLRAQIRDTDA
jgi:prephenate dehydratase